MVQIDTSVYMAAMRESHSCVELKSPAMNGTAAAGSSGSHHAESHIRQCLKLCTAIHKLHSIQTAGTVAVSFQCLTSKRAN